MKQAHIRPVNAHTVKQWIHGKTELALLDIREHGQFGEDHLFFATPLPYSILESHALRLMPRQAVRIALYGSHSDPETVMNAAQALQSLGYTDINYLEGGIEAWKEAGYGTFAGVNLPSKTFGELIEHTQRTPSISAQALHSWQADPNKNLLVLDGRPIDEFYKMNIPGAICCPNGELALRVRSMVQDEDTTVVINCAGRTRSIIGAQTLINLGIPNPVYALENGTQGWYLEDLQLEHKTRRHYPEDVDLQALGIERERAQKLRTHFDIPQLSHSQLHSLQQENSHSLFICDVRSKAEFQASDWPAYVQHTPGGQLVQATDQYVGVRRSTVVLCDTDGIRAPVVASWLKQMGWNVYLLPAPENLRKDLQTTSKAAPYASAKPYPAKDLSTLLQQQPDLLILDARPSMQFRQASLQKARWTIRPTLQQHLAGIALQRPVLVLANTDAVLHSLALDLERQGYQSVYLCLVSEQDIKHGPLWHHHETDPLSDEQCIDYLFFVHDRHDGNKEAARRYLEWETGLLAQLDEQERREFLI